ncbi:hypothetical protein BDW69DRAFT_201999 [Aspergillus filifer]
MAPAIAEEDLPTSLPHGFPDQLRFPLVWSGRDFSNPSDWTYYLPVAEVEEITRALHHFHSLDLPIRCISQATFPPPTLGPALRRLSEILHSDQGFSVICGLPIDKYTANETDSQSNGQKADVVPSHVVDSNAVVDRPAIGSPAFTADAQGFHTDTGDIVGLLMIGEGAEGGESCLASTGKIYNELAASRPDLICTLAGEWAIDGFGQSSTPYHLRPLLMPYARDALHFTARKHELTMELKKGDMQFINNLAPVHGRGAFRDEVGNRYVLNCFFWRHLLRLWLRDEVLGWEVPGPLKGVWDGVYGV